MNNKKETITAQFVDKQTGKTRHISVTASKDNVRSATENLRDRAQKMAKGGVTTSRR